MVGKAKAMGKPLSRAEAIDLLSAAARTCEPRECVAIITLCLDLQGLGVKAVPVAPPGVPPAAAGAVLAVMDRLEGGAKP